MKQHSIQTLENIWAAALKLQDVNDTGDFFDLGGNSQTALKFLNDVKKELHCEISFREFFRSPVLADIQGLIAKKLESEPPAAATLTHHERPENIPLSFSQERLWFVDQLSGSGSFHIPVGFDIGGSVDVELLEEAINMLRDRHEILRMRVSVQEGAPCMIFPEEQFEGVRKLQIPSEQVASLVQHPFDLRKDQLLRVWLIENDHGGKQLLIVFHHMITDGISLPLIFGELSALYNALVENMVPPQQAPTPDFVDFALMQRSAAWQTRISRQLHFWKDKLSGAAGVTLPESFERSAVQQMAGKVVPFQISPETTNALTALAASRGLTLQMLLLAVFKLLTHRYTSETDLCVGIPVSGRTVKNTGEIIGFFSNILPVRTQLDPAASFSTFMAEVKNAVLEALDNQDAGFEQIVNEVAVKRDMSRHPLFQLMFSLEEAHELHSLKLEGAMLTAAALDIPFTQTDLSLYFRRSSDGLTGTLGYSTALYTTDFITVLIRHFNTLLGQVLDRPDEPVSGFSLLSAEEAALQAKLFNPVLIDKPTTTVCSIIDKIVADNGAALAVTDGEKSLTYREFHHQAVQLASFLRKNGVSTGEYVPVCSSRSVEMVVAILGIIKAGAAYVPIDPSWPEARKAFIFNACKAKLVVCNKKVEHFFRETALQVAVVENIIAMPFIDGDLPLPPADSPAYLIFTSGTTGQPKGTIIPHTNLSALLTAAHSYFQFSKADVWSLFHSHCFDFSVWEIFGCFCNGGRLVIVDEETITDAAAFGKLILEQGVTVLNQTPQNFYVLQDYLTAVATEVPVKYVIFGGEALDITALQPWMKRYSPVCKLINMYGITETTVHVTFLEIKNEHLRDKRSLVGKPLPFLRVAVRDKDGHPLPPGIPGEICVSGWGVSSGYLNDPGLTAKKFVLPDTPDKPGTYYTGDIGIWLPEGGLVTLGRADDQVKIRGYRIGLHEVEHAIISSGLAERACVMALHGAGRDKQLAAFVVGGKQLTVAAVKAHLSNVMPAYMVPSWFKVLEAMPVNSNGKTDRKLLAEIYHHEQEKVQTAPQLPASQTEMKLTEIWSGLLGRRNISVTDNFFELGGHSLLVARMGMIIRRTFPVQITLRNVFNYPTIKELAFYIDSRARRNTGHPEISAYAPVAKLSFTQERLWFIDQLEGSVRYHVPYCIRLKGYLDVVALEKAFAQLAERHHILRTVFRQDKDQVLQEVLKSVQPDFELHDATTATAREFRRMKKAALDQPFHLSQTPPLRIRVYKTSDNEHVLLIVMHHIITDGWSYVVLVRELSALYHANIAGTSPLLPSLPIQYVQYAKSQQQKLSAEALARSLEYWKSHLADAQPLNIPKDRPYPPVQSGRGAFHTVILPGGLKTAVQQLAADHDATLFMVFLAAFKILLFRYTHQADINIGTPVSGRDMEQVEHLIGCFINTVVLRTSVDAEQPFIAYLHQVRRITLDAYDHQDMPFAKVVEALVKERDMSRSPLFQVMFSMENLDDDNLLQLDGISASPEEIHLTTTQFELNLYVRDIPSGIHLCLSYDTDLYDESTVARMMVHYQQLLYAICKDPAHRICELNILDEEEKNTLLYRFNNTICNYPQVGLHRLFEMRAAESPGNIAIRAGGQDVTYGELNRMAERIAAVLQSRHIQPGESVGLITPRSAWMVAGMLGILKTGGAYVPIDPEYPADRQHFLITKSGINTVLYVGSYHADELPADRNYLQLDALHLNEARQLEYCPVDVALEQLAYTIYTSGSTGTPKGVMITHTAAVNLVNWVNKRFNVNESDRLLCVTSMCFDLSVYDIFGMLAAGGTIVMASDTDIYDMSRLADLLQSERITFWDSVPSTFNFLVDDIGKQCPDYRQDCLRLAFLSGDWIPLQLPQAACKFFPQLSVISLGGATEGTVWSNYFPVECLHPSWKSIPYGRPIDNNFFYILDKYQQPVPAGVIGELYIGGIGVAAGYANDPDRTHAAFFKDPFQDRLGGRMYRTGDIGRMMKDGNMEFLGRTDDQVKIRGFRVEPGEIENVLMQTALLKAAVVLVRKDAAGTASLAAYVVPASDRHQLNQQYLLHYAGQWLPQYMVPSYIIILDELPLNMNGKIDKRKLLEMAPVSLDSSDQDMPALPMEKQVAAIWRQLLGVEVVRRNDSFFELGGHSLMVTRLLGLLRKATGILLPIRAIFQHVTLARMSALLETFEGVPAAQLDTSGRTDSHRLSESQQGIYIEHLLAGAGNSVFNVLELDHFDQPLDPVILENAVNLLISRHEILRSSIYESKDGPWMKVLPEARYSLPFRKVSDESFDAACDAAMAGLVNCAFDLTAWPLFSMHLVTSVSAGCLLMAFHHIITDEWSMQLVKHELRDIYRLLAEGKEPSAAAAAWQYQDFVNMQVKRSLQKEEAYWKEVLSGGMPRLDLFVAKPRTGNRTYDAGCLQAILPASVHASLEAFATETGYTRYSILLTIVHILLHELSGAATIITGAPAAGREIPELQEMYGLFVNTVVLKRSIDSSMSFSQLIEDTMCILTAALENQAYPFRKMAGLAGNTGERDRHPLFDVMVSAGEWRKNEQNIRIDQKETVLYGWKVKYDLFFNFTSGAQTMLMLLFNRSLFDEESIRYMNTRFVQLAGNLLQNPELVLKPDTLLQQGEQETAMLWTNDFE